MKQHHTHSLNTLIPQESFPLPSYCELIDALTLSEVISAAKRTGWDRTRESIYRHLDAEIFRIGVAHLDDPVPRDLYALYEELAVELKDKNPALEIPFLPAAMREEASHE